jgi:hypothetical protein
VGHLQHADLLQVDAGADAAAAQDALVHVAHHGMAGLVHLVPRLVGMPEVEPVHSVFPGQVLELAIQVPGAGVAFAVVVGQQQVHDVATGLPHLGGVGLHRDGGGDGVGAGGVQAPLPLDLHQADATHAGDAQVLVVAQGGDADVELLGRLQDGGAQGHLDPVAVDGDGHLPADGHLIGGRRHLQTAGPLARRRTGDDPAQLLVSHA